MTKPWLHFIYCQLWLMSPQNFKTNRDVPNLGGFQDTTRQRLKKFGLISHLAISEQEVQPKLPGLPSSWDNSIILSTIAHIFVSLLCLLTWGTDYYTHSQQMIRINDGIICCGWLQVLFFNMISAYEKIKLSWLLTGLHTEHKLSSNMSKYLKSVLQYSICSRCYS